MPSPTLSRKRKRGPSDAGERGNISLELSHIPVIQPGPVLVSFPSLQPPKSTAFQCYVREGEDDREFVKQNTVVAGETDSIEFSGPSIGEEDGLGSSYYLAVHHPSTGKVVLQPAPLHILTRQVKALKHLKPIAPTAAEHLQARNALGETFGTKKAQAAIRAYQRNKVDVSAMENVAGMLQDRIEEGTENLPTKDEAKLAADAARLIPPYNMDAETPEDAYPLHGIIPEQEWSALDALYRPLKNMSSTLDRMKSLPNVRSQWVREHLNLAYATPKPSSKIVKMLIYITTLMAFRSATGKAVPERRALLERLSPAPEVIVDGLLTRFTEKARGSTKAHMTSQTDTILLTSMFALCLRVDDYATDTQLMATDLKLGVTRINTLFRSLGCKIETLTLHDMKRLGLPDSAAENKRALLKMPLTFPKPRSGKRG
ncbi:hypothetical protein HETIRDRAFT_440794 [Heterobasidion irregulare TC 32-1]|uniref:RNA polymerase I associated factor, A49-like protein n=1 Tax=Heterobasidion irregulare (strain TC 32-1) TaxID=747525 RepID=W4K348_HETIT|nr:uncharacterized protein HETIRDRAFT_440794 [Heterobasidion irregulare TC 32-1]ETW79765.1 hypothetical protein HETIRDRAFT_440794 [Heterobasidion irregulare TC 32-1]